MHVSTSLGYLPAGGICLKPAEVLRKHQLTLKCSGTWKREGNDCTGKCGHVLSRMTHWVSFRGHKGTQCLQVAPVAPCQPHSRGQIPLRGASKSWGTQQSLAACSLEGTRGRQDHSRGCKFLEMMWFLSFLPRQGAELIHCAHPKLPKGICGRLRLLT